jgi:large subunit ribosomal protein L37Ae
MATKKVKSAGRFGARYGRKVRIKTADIESVQRKKQDCIFCNGKAKRLSKGIWQCNKCEKKFAGHTYFLPKKEE